MKNSIKYSLLLFTLLLFNFQGFSQNKNVPVDNSDRLIQISGVVLESDSLEPIPFTTVINQASKSGTLCDVYGYFSFVARPGDTLKFSSIGYKTAYFLLPADLSENQYSLIQIMRSDTILLEEKTVYPWPSKEQFKNAFVNMDIPNDEILRAMDNLSPDKMTELALNLSSDGSLTYKWKYLSDQQFFQARLYTSGGLPQNNVLNPIAWAQFIDAWKKGKFKQKK